MAFGRRQLARHGFVSTLGEVRGVGRGHVDDALAEQRAQTSLGPSEFMTSNVTSFICSPYAPQLGRCPAACDSDQA